MVGGVVSNLLVKKELATETSTTNSKQPDLGEEGSSNRTMTQGSDSQKEATTPTPLLSSKRISRIGTWNIRTMYEAGKVAQVAAEMRNYDITLLGLCETRWTQSGQLRLSTGEMVLYSGHGEENAPHTEGVALVLSQEAQKALISWEAAGSRIIAVSFRTKKKIKMNVIQSYEPTNDKDEETKEDFYNRLQGILDKTSDRDITIVMVEVGSFAWCFV